MMVLWKIRYSNMRRFQDVCILITVARWRWEAITNNFCVFYANFILKTLIFLRFEKEYFRNLKQ
jgi:hypothetical protein